MIVCQRKKWTVTVVFTGKLILTWLQVSFFSGIVFVMSSTFCAESSFDVLSSSNEAVGFIHTGRKLYLIMQ